MSKPELTPSQQQHYSELTEWVTETFGRYKKFYLYQEAFNNHFHGYQGDMNLKLDLDSLRSGLISCAVAAIVTGLWWEPQNKYPAEFFMTKVAGKNDNLHKRHVYLALPTIKILSDAHLLHVIKDSNYTLSPQVVDFERNDKFSEERKYTLNRTPKVDVPENIRRTTGVKKFAQERYALFNFDPQHPSPPTESSSSPSTHSPLTSQPQK